VQSQVERLRQIHCNTAFFVNQEGPADTPPNGDFPSAARIRHNMEPLAYFEVKDAKGGALTCFGEKFRTSSIIEVNVQSLKTSFSVSPDFSYPVRDVKRLRGAARNTGKRCGAQFARVIADGVRARVGRKPGSSYVWLVVLGRQRTAAASRKWARANSF